MKKFLLLFLISIFFFNEGHGQEVLYYIDNPQAKSIVRGFKGYPESPTGYYRSMDIERANYAFGVYRNVVRLWYGRGESDYINLLYHVFPTKELANEALMDEYVNDEKVLILDWTSMNSTSISISLEGCSLQPLATYRHTKGMSSYAFKRIESIQFVREVQNKCVIEMPDGKRKRFTLPNYVLNCDDLVVFINGKRQKRSKYTVYPQKRCIIFKRAPKKGREVTISNAVELDVVNYKLSFEGLSIEDNLKLINGTDSETGFNASYYSREARNVVLQGTPRKAWPEIVKSPERAGHALRFRAEQPNDKDLAGDKIRITGSVVGLNAVEIVNSVDIYIPTDWYALCENEAGYSWLTVQEYWCSSAGIPVEGEPQFRMTLGMLKNPGVGEGLYFDLRAEDIFTTLNLDGSLNEKQTLLYEFDDRKSKKFNIPFGEWFNLRTEIVAGDYNTGHFRLIVTIQNGEEVVIFDRTCQTFATGYLDLDTKQPLYKSESPLKLYTSSSTINRMGGKPLEIYFDNWDYTAFCIKLD